MLKHAMIILMSITLCLTPYESQASSHDQINLVPEKTRILADLLAKCDKAVRKCDKHVAGQAMLIVGLREHNDLLGERVIELESRSDNKLMWLAIGLAAGALTVSIVK